MDERGSENWKRELKAASERNAILYWLDKNLDELQQCIWNTFLINVCLLSKV